MFYFQINFSDLDQPISQSRDGWRFGESHLVPAESPALEAFCVIEGPRRFFYIRERDFGVQQIPGFLHTWHLSSADYKRFKTDALSWPMDFLALEIDPTAKEPIWIQAGPYQHAALFLLSKHGVLHGDWNPTRMYSLLPSSAINLQMASRLLYSSQSVYSKYTLFKDLFRLTKGSTATFSARNGLKIDYPKPSLHVVPRQLKSDADVVSEFISVCQHLIKRHIPQDANTRFGVHMSGGLDATTIAALLSGMGLKNLPAYTIHFPPDVAESDQAPERLNEIVRQLELDPNRIEFSGAMIFDSLQRRSQNGDPIWYMEHPHQLAHVSMVQQQRDQNVPVVFGGIGGDEVSSLSQAELSKFDPEQSRKLDICEDVPHTPEQFPYYSAYAGELIRDLDEDAFPSPNASCLGEFDVGYLSLRMGVWEQYPFTRSEITEFIRSLPTPWRQKKKIFREALKQLGFDHDFAYPENKFNAVNILEQSFLKNKPAFITELFLNSRLAEAGLLDPDRLIADYSSYINGQAAGLGDWSTRFYYQVANMELAIRSVEGVCGLPQKTPEFAMAAASV